MKKGEYQSWTIYLIMILKKYLENKMCRGCSNHCLLLEPDCNRSTMFIKDEYKKYYIKIKNDPRI